MRNVVRKNEIKYIIWFVLYLEINQLNFWFAYLYVVVVTYLLMVTIFTQVPYLNKRAIVTFSKMCDLTSFIYIFTFYAFGSKLNSCC